jgi:pyruvate kinase
MSSVEQHPPSPSAFQDLIRQMETLCQDIERQSEVAGIELTGLSADRLSSARNLLQYLALRSRDLRPLQDRLARLGQAVLHNLYLLNGDQLTGSDRRDLYDVFDEGAGRLELNTTRLMGEAPARRRVRIVVTMATAVADDYLMMHQLVKSGMNCMRINCAHDDPSTWSRMIRHLHNARHATGQHCRILMDLGGPKLRLGPMQSEPGVLKIRPVRAADGAVVRPARVWLTSDRVPFNDMPAADASLVLDQAWLEQVEAGDRIRFTDSRDSRRCWRVREVTKDGCWAETKKTCYLSNGVVLHLCKNKHDRGTGTQVNKLAPRESVSLIRKGDILFVSNSAEPGVPAIHDSHGELLNPARISLAVAEVYRDARPGEPVFFDDGRIEGIIEKRNDQQLQVRITHTRNPVEKLEGSRGINLPDTGLRLPALGTKDQRDIEFATRHADMIGLSFANSPEDVSALRQSLQELGREDIGVILKIETKRGFSNLPAMLLEALKFPACGVMIARGDLAVECGFERLSELQEEILWVCESAHVPVIWATQVLEGLTKRGHASRAEVTDAAMAQAAEAVMLNKGEHVIEAVEMLDDILQRMQGHHRKKRSMLRRLQLASEFEVRIK